MENSPVGTVVGEFNATDPEGEPLTYSLVSKSGGRDRDNDKFVLTDDGILSTAQVFDFEELQSPEHTGKGE